ncbi:MAG: winged helix-turn-helix domain-containing protein [Methanobacteriota archaeon]
MIDATKFVSDVDVEKILLGTYEREMTVRELSEAYGIPIATCYRKVRALEDHGLLSEAKAIMGRDGKIHKFYRANMENAYVYYEDGKAKVRFKVILDVAKDFRERYEALAQSGQAENDNQP